MGLYSLITGQDDNAGLDLSPILRRKETLRQEGGRQPVEPVKPPTGALAGASEEDTGPLATYRRQALANQASLMKAYGARQEASKGILEQLTQNKGNKNSEMWFQLAAALGKPTATGSFGETVGNVGEAMASSAAARNKAAQAQRELQAKYALGMLDTDVDIAKAQYEGATDIEKAILSSQDKAAEKAAERTDKANTPVRVGNSLVNPTTGKVIFEVTDTTPLTTDKLAARLLEAKANGQKLTQDQEAVIKLIVTDPSWMHRAPKDAPYSPAGGGINIAALDAAIEALEGKK